MVDRYFTHIVGCLEASIKTAEDGVDCRIPAVTAQGAVDLLKEQQERIERLQPKKGEWEPMEDYDDVVYRCSVCEEEWTLIEGTPFDNGMKFCPHCGADMRDSYHFVSNL